MNNDTAMHPSTVLRICVVLEWVLVGWVLALSYSLESSLPAALRDWLAADAERDLGLRVVALVVVMVPSLLAWLVGSIGLLFLKRWAAWVYLISLIVSLTLSPLFGPTVEHGSASAVNATATLLAGLIIGLAFFSDALRVRSARPGAAPSGGAAESVASPKGPGGLPSLR
jgi:hypothetical protein